MFGSDENVAITASRFLSLRALSCSASTARISSTLAFLSVLVLDDPDAPLLVASPDVAALLVLSAPQASMVVIIKKASPEIVIRCFTICSSLSNLVQT